MGLSLAAVPCCRVCALAWFLINMLQRACEWRGWRLAATLSYFCSNGPPWLAAKGLSGTMIARSAPRQSWRIAFSSLFWLLLFALLNGCDLITTYIDLHAGMREGNPLMRALLDQDGFSALIFYKALMVLVVSAGILTLNRRYPVLARTVLIVCNVVVLVVVLSNFLQYQL